MGRVKPSLLYMKTKRGVYYNLKESEYDVVLGGITFYFSSEFYKNNFLDRLEDEVEKFNQSANNVYKNKFSLDMDMLAIIRLYATIEKRGFYIIYEGREVTCLDNLTFELQVRIESY